MKALVSLLLALTLALPVHAAPVFIPEPVEQEVLERERIEKDLAKPTAQAATIETKKSGIRWYWWALAGVAIAGGAAAAAGGGGGGGGGTTPASTESGVQVGW